MGRGRLKTRSTEYKSWLSIAAYEYRQQFPAGVQTFKGRIRVDYIFIWNKTSLGRNSSDIGNREKVLSDFFEHKFFDNDNQIDEQHQYRRFVMSGPNRVCVRIYQIPDRRFDDWKTIFR